jgi:uncharacterized OB-fold protein
MNAQIGITPALDSRLYLPDDARAGEPVALAASRCNRCLRYEFPQKACCPSCGGDTITVALSRFATVAGFTSVLSQPPDALVRAPYVIVVAAFPEDLSILGLYVGASIDDVHLGSRLRSVAVAAGERVGFGFALVQNERDGDRPAVTDNVRTA